MKPQKYKELKDKWTINIEKAEAISPSKDSPPNQILLVSDDSVKNGSVSASITPIDGQKDLNWGYDYRECAFVFRYTNETSYYLAGIGGFGRKFYIAKVTDPDWLLIAGVGEAHSLKAGEQYNLKVEFTDDRITLFHDKKQVLNTIDSTYLSGSCGLRTSSTEAKFENVDIQAVKYKCFVIMPFDHELDFVYKVIKDTIVKKDMVCERADELFSSKLIMEDVKKHIFEAQLLVVDFTGKNPNVYYEAGLADAWKKKWIVLAQSKDDLDFDVQEYRAIFYSNKMGAEKKLRKDLEKALEKTMNDK